MNIVVTVPRHIEWQKYEEELAAVASGDIMNYRVAAKPNVQKGDKCYIVYRGLIRGYMIVHDVIYRSEVFKCTTTGEVWRPGWYIQRTGLFHRIEPVEMKGFQGFRYYH